MKEDASNGTEIGIITGVSVALLLVLVAALVFFIRRRKLENAPQPDRTVQMATQITVPDEHLKDLSTMQVIPQID